MLTLNQIENGRLTYEDNNGVSFLILEDSMRMFLSQILECYMCMFFTRWYCVRNWNG
jgi:hypothetical protein